MKIELAKHSGFCVGVRNAVNKTIEEINNCKDNILIQGPLIHSPQTVEILEKRGLKIIKEGVSIDNQVIAVRTHGITRQEHQDIKKRAKRIINLTCSNVAYVHAIVKKYSLKGYFTIILGDKNHAEVQAISSFAAGGFFIVSSLEEISDIPESKKYILVSQTTLDIDFFNRSSAILKSKYKDIEIINTICSATYDRQSDLHLAVKKGVDVIIVVGGKNSANTKRLARIGTENNIKTFHIETEDELNPDDLTDAKYVVVSAGASTPSWIVNNVLEKLYQIKYKSGIYVLLKSLFEFVIRTNIFSAFITFFMTIAVLHCADFVCDKTMPFLSSAFIFFMHSINNFIRPHEMQLSKPFKYKLYKKYKYFILFLTAVSLISYLFFALKSIYPANILYLIALVFGFIYAIPDVTKIASTSSNKFLRIFGVKSVITSLGWASVALIIPYTINPYNPLYFSSIFIIIFFIIFVRSILIDLIDYQGDLLLGIETFTTILGIKIAKIIIISLSALYIISVIYNALAVNLFALLYLMNIIYFYLLFKKIKANYYIYRLKFESLIDLNLLLFGVFSIISNTLS